MYTHFFFVLIRVPSFVVVLHCQKTELLGIGTKIKVSADKGT